MYVFRYTAKANGKEPKMVTHVYPLLSQAFMALVNKVVNIMAELRSGTFAQIGDKLVIVQEDIVYTLWID